MARPRHAGPGQVLRALALAALVAAGLGSKPLLDWTNRLPDTPATAAARAGAARWHAAMTALGLAGAYPALHGLMRRMNAAG